jgi:hypothetical protein
MKTFALFNMVACYICTMMCVMSFTYNVIFVNEFGNALIMALAGGAMFFIAEALKNEWRQGKLDKWKGKL